MEVKTSIREEDGKTQVDITVSAAEVQEHIDDTFKQLRKNRIPGFRPGRAPRPVLEQNFGGHDAVFAQITEDLINDISPKAVDSEDILFIASPEFSETENVVEGQDFSWTITGKVKPEMEILTCDPVSIKMPPAETSDAEIDAQVEQLRTYYYSFEDIEGRAVEAGDYVTLDLACTNGDDAVQGLNSSERLVELGQGILPADLEAEVIGMNVGDTKEFDFSIEGEDSYAYLEVDSLHAKVTLNGIKERKAPELDEEFAKRLGVDSIDALRTMIKDAVDKQKAEQLPVLKENRCIEALAERLHGAVPVAYTNFTRQDVLREFYTNLQNQGVTMDQFLAQQGITADDFQKDLEEEAKEVAEQTMALDALYRGLGLEITEEDIVNEFSVAEDPEATRKQWEDAGRMSEIREAIRRRKATEWLVETAIVTETLDEDDDEDEE